MAATNCNVNKFGQCKFGHYCFFKHENVKTLLVMQRTVIYDILNPVMTSDNVSPVHLKVPVHLTSVSLITVVQMTL